MMTAALAVATAAKKSRKKNRFVAGIDLSDIDEGEPSSSSSSLCLTSASSVLQLSAPNVSLNEPTSQTNIPKAGNVYNFHFN